MRIKFNGYSKYNNVKLTNMKKGSKGLDVVKLQTQLYRRGYDKIIEPGDIVDIPETFGSIIFGNTGFVQALTSIATLMLAYQATLR